MKANDSNLIVSDKNKKIGLILILSPWVFLVLTFLLYAVVNAIWPSPLAIINQIIGILAFIFIFLILIGIIFGLKKFATKEVSRVALDSRSGEGAKSIIPKEIKKFNWGAVGLTWIWGAYHGVWRTFFIVVLGAFPQYGIFVLPIFLLMLGFKGNEMAWTAQKYESVEKFLEKQNRWKKWGIASLILQILCLVLASFLSNKLKS